MQDIVELSELDLEGVSSGKQTTTSVNASRGGRYYR